MKQTECSRETDVIDAVSSGRWPGRGADALSAHIAACAICAEVAVVARALQDDHDAAWRDARIPSAGRVWWRAEMRARQEAARKAAQPMAFAQAAAAACGGGVLIALVVLFWPALHAVVSAFGGSSLSALPSFALPLAIGSILLIAPIALYLVFSEK